MPTQRGGHAACGSKKKKKSSKRLSGSERWRTASGKAGTSEDVEEDASEDASDREYDSEGSADSFQSTSKRLMRLKKAHQRRALQILCASLGDQDEVVLQLKGQQTAKKQGGSSGATQGADGAEGDGKKGKRAAKEGVTEEDKLKLR